MTRWCVTFRDGTRKIAWAPSREAARARAQKHAKQCGGVWTVRPASADLDRAIAGGGHVARGGGR